MTGFTETTPHQAKPAPNWLICAPDCIEMPPSGATFDSALGAIPAVSKQTFLTLSDGNACRGEAGGLLGGASMHPESPAHARPALVGSHGPLPLQRRLADQRLWLSLCLIHPRPRPFTSGHGLPVRAGQLRSRPVVNSGAQYSKACEGATLPWVQIPPPPLLTCENIDPGADRRARRSPPLR
jgi:hypothetical protein